ncbi:MAG: winged helix DNA-binding protein [Methanomassiliicoccales archaeon]
MSMAEEDLRKIAVLENRYALQILIVLKDGPLGRLELYQRLRSSPTTPIRRIEKLIKAGLITEKVLEDQRTHELTLTPKGRDVAELAERMLQKL